MKNIGMASMIRVDGRLSVRTSAGLRVRPYRCKEGWRFYPAFSLTRHYGWVIAVAMVYRWVSHGRGRRRTRSLEPWTRCSYVTSADGHSFTIVCDDGRTGKRVDPRKIDRLDVQFGIRSAEDE